MVFETHITTLKLEFKLWPFNAVIMLFNLSNLDFIIFE